MSSNYSIPCVYFLRNDRKTLLYIGKTNNLKKRIREHLKSQERRGEEWKGYIEIENEVDREIIETYCINLYKVYADIRPTIKLTIKTKDIIWVKSYEVSEEERRREWSEELARKIFINKLAYDEYGKEEELDNHIESILHPEIINFSGITREELFDIPKLLESCKWIIDNFNKFKVDIQKATLDRLKGSEFASEYFKYENDKPSLK